MEKIRFIVNDYTRFSNHYINEKYDFNCISMRLSQMQEHFTGVHRVNWVDGNRIQLKRLFNEPNVEIFSHEQMYSIAEEVRTVPTFYVVTISEISAMFETGWVHWLPKNVLSFLRETGVPILLSQPGEFGFEWLDTKEDVCWLSQVYLAFNRRLHKEGLSNPIVIHNMSKIYMDLRTENRSCESVYSRQWIEHVKLPSNLERGTLTYQEHLQNVQNKEVFFCSNRGPRESRCLLLLSMIKNNTLKDGHLSFLCESPPNVKIEPSELKNYFTSLKYFSNKNRFKPYEEYIEQALSILPIDLEEDETLKREHVLVNNSINKYRLRSMFEIVTETHDFTKESVQAGVLSEKVFWPIVNQMPFVVMGHRRNSDLLKELGFKTFDEEFIVEAHPTVDIFERVEYIDRIIKIFKNFTAEEKFNWYNSDVVREKIEHNYNLLVNTNWNNNEIGVLSDAFKQVMFTKNNRQN